MVTTSTVFGAGWMMWVARDAGAGVRVEIHADYGRLERIRVDAPGLTMDGDYREVIRLMIPPEGGTMEDLARNLAYIAGGMA